jgi:hypothetical protein
LCTQGRDALNFDKPLGHYHLVYKYLARRIMKDFIESVAGIFNRRRATNVFQNEAKRMREDGATKEAVKEFMATIPVKLDTLMKTHTVLIEDITKGVHDAVLPLALGLWEKPAEYEGRKPKAENVLEALASNWTSTRTNARGACICIPMIHMEITSHHIKC